MPLKGGTRGTLASPLSERRAQKKRPPGVPGSHLSWRCPSVNPWPYILGLGRPCSMSHSPREGGRTPEPPPLGWQQEAPRGPCLRWPALCTCSEGLGPGQKWTPFLEALLAAKGGAHQLWLRSCCWALGSQGPGGHLPPHPLTHSLSL